MNARVEPLRAGLAILTTLGLVIAMLMVVSGPRAAGQASDPDTECSTATGYNGEWWKVQINENGTTGTIETSTNVDNDDISFSLNSSGATWTYSWTNQSSDGYAVVRVVEKEGQGEDIHNGVWLVGEGFSGEELDSDISHLTFCFGTAPTTTAPTTTPTTSTPTTTPTTSTPTTTPTTSTPTTTPTTSTPTTTPTTSTPTTVSATGNIVVTKQVAQGDPQNVAFNFTTTGFTLDDNSLAHGESGSATVAAGGPYSVSESVLTGWELVSSTCDSTDQADDSTPADINVSPGETVTCTFVNEVPDDVLGTVITTVPDEVEGTTIEAEELPFTGVDSDRLVALGVLLLATGLVAIGVTGRREEA